jgi:hypothetical protein
MTGFFKKPLFFINIHKDTSSAHDFGTIPKGEPGSEVMRATCILILDSFNALCATLGA